MTYKIPHDPPADDRAESYAQPRNLRRSRRLFFHYSCAVAAFTFSVDLISKQFALQFLSTENRIHLLGELFGLQLAFNTGAAFSIGSQLTPFITLLGLVASLFLVWAALRTRYRIHAAAIGLVLGGALGNLVDRIFAPPGFGSGAVTDFLVYGQLFIGNIADVAIGVGVMLYAFGAWRLYTSTRTLVTVDSAKDDVAEPPTTEPSATSAETTQP